MNSSIVRTLPAALALAVACIGGAAVAQTTTQKTENAGEKAWDATKHGTKKAVNATEKGAKSTGKAIDNVATDAADGTRNVGNKIGEKIPGTEQHDAVKKP